MLKNAQTTAQLHSSHMLEWSKFSKSSFNSTWAMNLQMFKLDLEKAEEPEIKLPTSVVGPSKKLRECQKNICFCSFHYAKALDCVDHNKLWKIHKVMGTPDHLTCLLRNLYAGYPQSAPTQPPDQCLSAAWEVPVSPLISTCQPLDQRLITPSFSAYSAVWSATVSCLITTC